MKKGGELMEKGVKVRLDVGQFGELLQQRISRFLG
jgi:hypothetical protein